MTTDLQTPVSDRRSIKTWLEAQYGANATANIIEEMETLRAEKVEIDYMRFKELSEVVEITRAQAMMDSFRVRKSQRGKSSRLGNRVSVRSFEQNDIVPIEGRMQERQASESWALYRKANHLFHALYKQEIDRCKQAVHLPISPLDSW